MVDFKRIKLAIKLVKRSSENIAPKIGLSGNGLRNAFKKETMTLITYDKLCAELKIHPSFLWDKESDPTDYMYKGKIHEKQYSISEIEKLNREISHLKDSNMKLQSRVIEMMDEKRNK
jgi:hypothetical protein